jgi:hypothetical protein
MTTEESALLDNLRIATRRLVDYYNHQAGVVLDSQSIANLTNSLCEFACRGAEKYIRGQKEHGGNIADRDLFKELQNEIIDAWHYNVANQRKYFRP